MIVERPGVAEPERHTLPELPVDRKLQRMVGPPADLKIVGYRAVAADGPHEVCRDRGGAGRSARRKCRVLTCRQKRGSKVHGVDVGTYRLRERVLANIGDVERNRERHGQLNTRIPLRRARKMVWPVFPNATERGRAVYRQPTRQVLQLSEP